jgi:hypothetical protein
MIKETNDDCISGHPAYDRDPSITFERLQEIRMTNFDCTEVRELFAFTGYYELKASMTMISVAISANEK